MKSEDRIKQRIYSELSDFEAPLPQDGWMRIEEALTAADSKSKRMHLWRWAGAAAAVAALFVAGWLFMQKPETITENIAEVENNSTPQKQIINPPKTTSENTTQPTPAPQTTKPTTTRNLLAKATIPKADNIHPISQEQNVTAEKQQPHTDTTPITSAPALQEQTSQADNISEIDRLTAEFAQKGQADIFADEAASTKKREHSNKKTMISIGGKGGITPYNAETNSIILLRSAKAEDKSNSSPNAVMSNIDNNPTEVLSNPVYASGVTDNVAKMRHSRPLSFGITFSREVIENIAVETGIVYTYLHSNATNSATTFRNNESQEFHYLGIPLNVNYTFFSWEGLHINISMGGTMEKDIYGASKYYDETSTNLSHSERKLTDKISQKYPQFSVNGSLGISYPIYGDLWLYAKGGVSYYFNAKNEYKTIYSDKIILPDLQLGLRIEF